MLYQAPPSDASKTEGSLNGGLETEVKKNELKESLEGDTFVASSEIKNKAQEMIAEALHTARADVLNKETPVTPEAAPEVEEAEPNKEVKFNVIPPSELSNLVEISGENLPNAVRLERLNTMLETLAHNKIKPGDTPFTIAKDQLGLNNKPEES